MRIAPSEPSRTIDDFSAHSTQAIVRSEGAADADVRWQAEARKARDAALRLLRSHHSKGSRSWQSSDSRNRGTVVDGDAELIAQYLEQSRKLHQISLALAMSSDG